MRARGPLGGSMEDGWKLKPDVAGTVQMLFLSFQGVFESEAFCIFLHLARWETSGLCACFKEPLLGNLIVERHFLQLMRANFWMAPVLWES